MKTLVAVVLLTLICIVHRASAGSEGSDLVNSKGCCPVYSTVRVPVGRIKNVVMTSNHCPSKDIVVTTVCEKEICFNHQSVWAKTVLDKFQKSTANNTSPSAPSFNVFKCNEKKNKP